ncbi:TPA_asm: coat protein [ssRNA phage Gerhypos.3_21]|uniref:Coat protein n=2 Tax=Leviviricetes TaxID=2842243 RepID=A0A8S5L4D8_9VIRU|nr:coat protein [ssRNA phage Gerhypos.3_21]QDH88234.1 MAG: hypothetical protein H3Bulk42291_000002 [Leviviridae sp.]DAD52205.1 TPA_asm: coat protein [ssRNA phage Gerhypos.3_21]
MAFSDPQSVTISGSAISLPNTGRGLGIGTYSSNDGSLAMDIRNTQSGKSRSRRTIGVVSKKYAEDPTREGNSLPVSATVRLVVDTPAQGYTPADIEAILVGFIANLTASSNANIKKLLGGES